MKKLMMVSVMSLIPLVGFAKVSDFNAMITDNMKSQSQLHNTVQDNVDIVRVAKEQQVEGNTVVETGSDTYNAPTHKSALKFDKEKKQPKTNDRVQFDRVATELNESEY